MLIALTLACSLKASPQWLIVRTSGTALELVVGGHGMPDRVIRRDELPVHEANADRLNNLMGVASHDVVVAVDRKRKHLLISRTIDAKPRGSDYCFKSSLMLLNYSGRVLGSWPVEVPWDTWSTIGFASDGSPTFINDKPPDGLRVFRGGHWSKARMTEVLKRYPTYREAMKPATRVEKELSRQIGRKVETSGYMSLVGPWADLAHGGPQYPEPWYTVTSKEPAFDAEAVNNLTMIIARWGNRILHCKPSGEGWTDNIRLLKYPMIIARFNHWNTILNQFKDLPASPNDPWIESEIVLLNMKTGDLEVIGPGSYVVML